MRRGRQRDAKFFHLFLLYIMILPSVPCAAMLFSSPSF